jgi:hypothetical protein
MEPSSKRSSGASGPAVGQVGGADGAGCEDVAAIRHGQREPRPANREELLDERAESGKRHGEDDMVCP